MIKWLHKFFFSLSFRTHLILLVLLLSLPSVALISYSGSQQRKDSLNDGITDTKMLVHSILTEQYNMSGDAAQLITTLAQLADVKEHRVAACNRILADIIKLNHQFLNIVITDASGRIWASALPFNNPLPLRGNRAFDNALRTRQFSSGEYGIGRVSGKPGLNFGYPILDAAGVVQGAIIASIDFGYLNDLLTESGLPKGSSFTFTDHKGVVVYSNANSTEKTGDSIPESVFRQMREGVDAFSFLDSGLTREKMITSYGKLRLRGEEIPYLYVKAGIPLHETLVKARRAELVNIAILSPVLLVAVLLASLLAKFCFVNRILRLQEAAQRLAGGDLSAGVSAVSGGGELGELGRSFDEMAHKLAARERALVRSEAELNELNRTLARRVERETEKRLEQERLLARHARLAAIGEMIGAIAHQWRQPLATLGAVIQSLRMAWEHDALDTKFLERAEADAQKQLYYMSDTIEDFRNFFSPEKVVETFGVRDKIEEVSLLVSAQFANSQVALKLLDGAAGEPVKIRGYQNEFKQSVLNLVSNAFDAVIIKGVEHGEVTIALGREPGGVVIEVRDNGCGIAPEIAEKVWEPYFTSKADGKGTGIGLYMSKLIVEESMGGSLGFTSSPEGTVFRIVLPHNEKGAGDE